MVLSPELAARVGSAHPLPIADAVAAIGAAESLHERRDRVVEAFRAQVRYVAAVALAVRVQYGPGPGDESKQLAQLLRGLRSRGLTDGQWVALLRGLMGSWQKQPDAYPIPALAALFAGKSKKPLAQAIDGLLEMRKAETVAHGATGSADAIRHVLDRREPQLSSLIERFDPVWEQARLVVPLESDDDGQGAHELMGYAPGRGRFRRIRLDGDRLLAPGEPLLVDGDGRPVVSLHPIALFRRPSPDAQEELFLLDGARKDAAVFVALPSMAEHRERGVWNAFGSSLFGEAAADIAPPSTGGVARPYRGLTSFSAAESALFFGREQQAEALANRIRRHLLVTVTGASGSGKSSLLFAGVLPLLDDADVVTMRPGADPVGELERATFRVDDSLKVLVVDQAEELFTMCHDEARRRAFADALVAAGDRHVLLSLREDFFARLATLPALRGVYTRQVEVVTTPDEDDLMRILVQPAELFGFRFEEAALVEEMVQQVHGEPAALAMLQFCADQLWERRDRAWKRLTWDAYRALGGVEGALAAHAEATLAEMTAAQQGTVRAAFLRLVTEEGTRATVPKPDLLTMVGEQGEAVLDKLLDARLLTSREIEVGGDPVVVVELVHEALLGHWDRLKDWLGQDEEFLRVRARVAQAAARWDGEGRLGDMLLGEGKPLLEATEIQQQRGQDLTATETEFIVASQSRARRLVRLKRAAVAGLVVLTVLAAGAAVLALQARERAESAARAATDSEQLAVKRSINLLSEQGRRELLDGRPLKALVYLTEAYEQGGDGPALRGLLGSASRPADALEAVLDEGGPALYWTAFTGRGDRLVAADVDGWIEVWRTEDHASVGRFAIGERRASQLELVGDDSLLFVRKGDVHLVGLDGRERRLIHAHDKAVMAVAVAPDGRIVTGSLDHDAKIFDERGDLQSTLAGHAGGVMSVALSPDALRVATGSRDKTARIWDLESGQLLHTLDGHVRGLFRVLFSPDGARLVTTSANEVWLWDVASGRRIQTFEGHQHSINSVRFVGDRLLTGAHDNTARLWTMAGKSQLSFGGHDDFARGGAFTPATIRDALPSPDGATFLTRGSDATVRIWDATTGGRLETLMGHLAHVNGMAIHPETGQVATAGDEGKLVLWRRTHGALRETLGDDRCAVKVAHFDPGGMAVVCADGRVQLESDGEPQLIEAMVPTFVTRRGDRILLVDEKSGKAALLDGAGKLLARLDRPGGGAHHGDLQPKGDVVATASEQGAQLWRDGKLRHSLPHDQPVRFVRFSPDGQSLLAVERGGAKLWNVEDGALRFEVPAPKESASLAPSAVFDASGTRVLMMTSALHLPIYDTRDGREILKLDGARGAFSADGTKLLVAATSPLVRIYDGAGEQLATLDGHTEPIVELGFLADGRAVTAARDGTVRLWDAATGKALEILNAHRGAVQGAWLDPTTARILTMGDGRAKLWTAAAETRRPPAIADLCRRVAPWELVDGHLVERRPAPSR